MRRWSVKGPDGSIYSAVSTRSLVSWAKRGVINPEFVVSLDQEVWVGAHEVPELAGFWDQSPAERAAAQATDKASEPEPEPMRVEIPSNAPQAETALLRLKEAEERIGLLTKELQQRENQISTLQKELTIKQEQDELHVEGPSPEILTAQRDAALGQSKLLQSENESLEATNADLRTQLQQASAALEHAQEDLVQERESLTQAGSREQTLKERIKTLESIRKETAPTEDLPLDETLYAILQEEYNQLAAIKEEEMHQLAQLAATTKAREQLCTDRLLKLRLLLGDSPEKMRKYANEELSPRPITIFRKQAQGESTRLQALEKTLKDALARESEIQKQLVSFEAREAHYKVALEQAQRQTLDSLALDEKLRETLTKFDHERQARQKEHEENNRVQQQLLRRIEELEHTMASANAPTPPPEVSTPPELPRTNFDWLRRK